MTKLNETRKLIRNKNQPTSILIRILGNVEDHFVELDSNAKKNQLKSNKSVEAVCITNQTVVQFKHHKAEQIKPNQKE